MQNNTETFYQYLQSMVKLEELQKMTDDLDQELKDSQDLMSEIRSIYTGQPLNRNENQRPYDREFRRQQLMDLITVGRPRLVMPDMVEVGDINVEAILAELKQHAEDLKQKILVPAHQQDGFVRHIEDLNLEQYATSFKEFASRIDNMKLSRNDRPRNEELEIKLSQLYIGAIDLTQLIKVTTKLAEQKKSGMQNPSEGPSALVYNNHINKLLNHINEATFLMQNKT